jgi:hypothetical protein
MRAVISILLYFVSLWGFIAVWVLGEDDVFPVQWYIVLPLIILACGWAYLFKYIAERFRDKYLR